MTLANPTKAEVLATIQNLGGDDEMTEVVITALDRMLPPDPEPEPEPVRRYWVVTYDVPVYRSYPGIEPDEVKDIVRSTWREQSIWQKLQDALEGTDWFVGEPYDDESIEVDETPITEESADARER